MGKCIRAMKNYWFAVVALIVVVILSGCSAPERGQSIENATASINSVDGLTGEAKSEGSYSGWVFDRWSTVQVNIEPGYEVRDKKALIEWMVKLGWSIADDRPNRAVTAAIKFESRDEFNRWKADLEPLGLPTAFVFSELDHEVGPEITVAVRVRSTDEAGLGPWPGEVPTLPDNVIVSTFDG